MPCMRCANFCSSRHIGRMLRSIVVIPCSPTASRASMMSHTRSPSYSFSTRESSSALYTRAFRYCAVGGGGTVWAVCPHAIALPISSHAILFMKFFLSFPCGPSAPPFAPLTGATAPDPLERRHSDEGKPAPITDKHQQNQTPRPPGSVAEFMPDGHAPDGCHQRCSLPQSVRNSRAYRPGGNQVQAEGQHPDHPAHHTEGMEPRRAAEISAVTETVHPHEHRVQHDIAGHQTRPEKPQRGVGCQQARLNRIRVDRKSVV